MDDFNEFSEYSGDLIEFPSTWKWDKLSRLTNSGVQTEPLPINENKLVQTNENKNIEVQTDSPFNNLKAINEQQLALWLKKIYPLIEAELNQGVTPIYDQNINEDDFEDLLILPYQKISIDDSTKDLDASTMNLNQPKIALAIWLSVKANNAPSLVVAATPIHNNFCEHFNPTLKVFSPKRIESQNFVVFSEVKTLQLKTCIKSLATNHYDKNIFCGGTVTGDLYIWKLTTTGEIDELFSDDIQHGCIIGMDWINEKKILCCHENGIITMWKVGKEILKDLEFCILSSQGNDSATLTSILALPPEQFIVGSTDGKLFFCSISNNRMINKFYNPIISQLESHKFSVTSLMKTTLSGIEVVLSCDLSGELYFHDIKSSEDEPNLIVKMPLPYKNSIALSKNGNFIFSPGPDGSLDIFSIKRNTNFAISGYQHGKGNFVKISENGLWIITGVYNGVFQIFKVEQNTN